MAWARGVKGVLLDVTGVLYNSGPGGGTPIKGSKEAIDRLRRSGLPFKLCSNESVCTNKAFADKLRRHGFILDDSDLICPAPITAALLQKENLRPFLLVHQDVLPEFSSLEASDPNCVVMGDCQDQFTYDMLNRAFRILLGLEEKKLFTLGSGKFYSEGGELVLDVGSYAAMLEFATGCQKIVCGKPQPSYFSYALDSLGSSASECVMIGDDIVHDVGGAQAMGMKGIQVRTGKYRPCDEPHPLVTPDAYVDDLAQAVDLILASQAV